MSNGVSIEGHVGMHGDQVPAYSVGEWFGRLAIDLFRGTAKDGTPSLSYAELVKDFKRWTDLRCAPDPPADPDATPVDMPRFEVPMSLYENAFRRDLKDTLNLEREVVLAYDVSHHNGLVDHGAFRRSGYTIGIAKATEGGMDARGKGFTDKRFHENWAAMEKEGLIRTAYHFARVSRKTSDGFSGIERDARNEADWFLMHYGNEVKPGMLPPVLDIEWDRKATADGITSQEVVAFCVAFVQRIRDKLGVWPIIYTGPNFHRYRLRGTMALSKCPLWIVAGYTNRWEVPAKREIEGWDWFMHQHTNEAPRPDAAARVVDANYFRGTLADLRAMAGIPEYAAPLPSLAA